MKSKHLSKGKVIKHGYWVKSKYVSRSNTGYWTKWGGGRYVEIVDLPEWTCQACNQSQLSVLPSFTMEYPIGEKIRICGMCKYVLLRFKINSFIDLTKEVRHTNLFSNLANLLTLPII